MGYGIFNASGLDRENEPKTFHFDYAYTTEEDFGELQASGDAEESETFECFSQQERDDEVESWSHAICAAGNYLIESGAAVTSFNARDRSNQGIYSPYGFRDQDLKYAFLTPKVGCYWQQEPFMGNEMCVVVAPRYQFDEAHDVWSMDDSEFHRAHHMSIERYKAAAQREAVLIEAFVLAWMEDQMNAVSNGDAWCGSGYTGAQYKPENVKPLAVVTALLIRKIGTSDHRLAMKREREAAQAQRQSSRMDARAAALGDKLTPFRRALI